MKTSEGNNLTDAQNELYAWIKDYMRDFQHSPSIRQMMQAMGLKSPAPIQSRLKHLQEKGYTVVETGNHNTDLTPSKYHACEFDDMVNLISHCEFYIGGDNGPMHIARGFNKPCIVINGAALTYMSNPNRENIMYLVNNNDSNLGLKHQQFINYSPNGQGITFVPIQKDGNDHCGIRDISPSDFIEAFNLFEDNNFSGSFISNYEADKISFKEFSIEEIEKV